MENNFLQIPRVAVIVPNYNHAKFLHARLSSVLLQSYKEFECFILDDASTDTSSEIIEQFKANDERIHYYPSTINSGSTFIQWNKAVQIANADFIWIAESDDKATPDFLAELMKPLYNNDKIVLAYCQSYRMNDKDEITGNWEEFTNDLDNELFKNDFVMDGKEYIERFLINKNTIPNASAVLFRKDIYKKVGGAADILKTNGDWLTWLKMLCYGEVAFIAKPMNYFRYHGTSVIAKASEKKNKELFNEEYDYTLRKAFKKFLKQEKLILAANACKTNDYFIALDKGNKGLYNLRKGRILQGWKQILAASFYPTLQSGFIKKGISGK